MTTKAQLKADLQGAKRQITDLQERLCKLENPAEFAPGDKVQFNRVEQIVVGQGLAEKIRAGKAVVTEVKFLGSVPCWVYVLWFGKGKENITYYDHTYYSSPNTDFIKKIK